MSKKKNTTKFKHFHLHGVFTESVTVMVEQLADDPNKWTISWAICNPTDTFSRKIGRQIAQETQLYRGYDYIVKDNESPLNEGIGLLMTSKHLSNDREVLRFREALIPLLSPEKTEEMSKLFDLMFRMFHKANPIHSYNKYWKK